MIFINLIGSLFDCEFIKNLGSAPAEKCFNFVDINIVLAPLFFDKINFFSIASKNLSFKRC